MADRNKTELTLRVTEAAALWLSGLGCKCVESEVPVAEKWVADLASIWSPTRTEAERHKLIQRAPSWRRNCDRDVFRAQCEERQAAFTALPGRMTVVVEVKTSVGDFRGDDKWLRPSPADIRILAMPSKMIPKQQWPKDWWVILHHDKGGHVAIAQRAPLASVDDSQRLRVAASIAERRHNRTAYAYWRDMRASHTNDENNRVNRIRIEKAIELVAKLVAGEIDTLEGQYVGQGQSVRVPFWLQPRLDAIMALRQQN
jgi:hypothetical protein